VLATFGCFLLQGKKQPKVASTVDVVYVSRTDALESNTAILGFPVGKQVNQTPI